MLLRYPLSGADAQTEQMVHAAQQGDQQSLALLLEHHYAGMLAVAIHLLGHGPDAEDACQDAAITALARIGELRDAGAVRAWLHAIVRNNCRTILRARKPVPVGTAGEDLHASELDDPVAYIERSAQRDWIWHGLRQLSPTLQPVAMLRYFTENNSYEHIAALCGVPVGTVRSRLSEVRRQLTITLPRVRDDRHHDASTLTAERREEAAAILSAVANGVPQHKLDRRWAADMAMRWPSGTVSTGLGSIFAAMGSDYNSGVRYRLVNVVAGPGITIWENEFINPPEDPDHCPPAATWLLREKAGLVGEVRLIHAARPGQPRAR
ncbi:RNA polymerase sigma factor [Dactylosporangium darangshiense]|uniref:Sigma-70 family RNA polymerase sigma factor n=1 Tax=Dactylosporangium darangshiense TaxID=579108 RepID=A0ABP8DM00_9ACTN